MCHSFLNNLRHRTPASWGWPHVLQFIRLVLGTSIFQWYWGNPNLRFRLFCMVLLLFGTANRNASFSVSISDELLVGGKRLLSIKGNNDNSENEKENYILIMNKWKVYSHL